MLPLPTAAPVKMPDLILEFPEEPLVLLVPQAPPGLLALPVPQALLGLLVLP